MWRLDGKEKVSWVDVQSIIKATEDRSGNSSGCIHGNHDKKRRVEMEDNPEWISTPRTRYAPKRTRCRDGRKGCDELRAKGHIMARSALPGY